MYEKRFPTGHINKSISVKRLLELVGNDKKFQVFLNSAPNLLSGESKILRDLNINHRIWSRSLNKTHLENYSLCCDLFINKKESILNFYKEIGFSLSYKQQKLVRLIKDMEAMDGIKAV